MTGVRRLLRALASLAVLAVLVAGVPWLLARYGNWPITGPPDRDWLDRLGDTAVSDTTVFAVLTVAAWVVWALFVTSVAVEFSAGLRGLQAPHLAVAGPLQRLARVLVVTVLLGLSTHHAPRTDAATRSLSATPATTTPVTMVHTLPAPIAQIPAEPTTPLAPTPVRDVVDDSDGGIVGVDAATGENVVLTRRGDTPWGLAERHLGAGERWPQLWERNRDTVQADGNRWDDAETFYPNWLIRIPTTPARDAATAVQDATATTPAHAATSGSTVDSVATTAGPAGVSEVVHVVEAGDTLWDLAARYLGDPTRYDELYEANQARAQADGRQLDDPNLILPGWRLVIPAASPAPPPQPLPAPVPVPPTAPSTTPPPATTTSTTTTLPAPTSMPPTTLPPPTLAVKASFGQDVSIGVGVPAIAGVGGALVLSSAVASRIVWLRRRRATRSAPHPVGTVENTVLSSSAVPLVRWAGQQLARLVTDLDRRSVTAGPVAVELSEDAGLEVLWDQPQHASPPAPWISADGGWAWRLAYESDQPVPPAEAPAGIPALVTVGHRQGRQLLVDLEAFGVVTVAGPDESVDAWLRAVAVELATGDDLSDAYVTTDVDTGVDVQLDRLTTQPLHDILDPTTPDTASTGRVADATAIRDTFRERVGTSTPIEATVLVAGSPPPHIAGVGDLFPPRSAVAAVIAHAPIGVGAHVQLNDDGSARLDPLDITFHHVGLPRDAGRDLGSELEALATLPDGPDDATTYVTAASPSELPHMLFSPAEPAPVNGKPVNGMPVDAERAASPSIDGTDTNTDSDSAHPGGEGSLVVHVLGVPAIADRPGLRRRELALAVLLASRGGTLAASAAQDALWGGTPVEPKTVWNLVTRTRRALGEFHDGDAVMPATDRTHGMLRLDPRVTTDLAMLVDRIERARDASSSQAIGLLVHALNLVDGPPYDAAGYEWAHRDQDVAYAATAIEQAADLLVGLALDADHVDVARDGLVKGLRGLPGNENLYRLRMRVEHHAGNHTAIASAYAELSVYLDDLESEPSPLTTALFNELSSRRHVHSD